MSPNSYDFGGVSVFESPRQGCFQSGLSPTTVQQHWGAVLHYERVTSGEPCDWTAGFELEQCWGMG